MSRKRYEVIEGARCNMLTAIREGPYRSAWNRTVVCKCDCGKEITTEFSKFRARKTKSCGCAKSRDYVEVAPGDKFNRLTYLSELEPQRSKQGWVIRRALFQCDCGKEHAANLHAVRNGAVKSCGCFRVERQKVANASHGMSGTPTYKAWNSMMSKAWYQQASVCPKWKKFEGFLKDMGERPERAGGIVRISKKEGFNKRNTRWSFREILVKTSGQTTTVQIDGIDLSLTRAAARMNVNKDTFFDRLARGWEVRRALTTPAKKQRGKN